MSQQARLQVTRRNVSGHLIVSPFWTGGRHRSTQDTAARASTSIAINGREVDIIMCMGLGATLHYALSYSWIPLGLWS